MRLGTVADLATAIGFDPGVQTAALEAAVEAGTQNLIASLGTELERAAIVDTFYILPTGSIPLGNEYRTRLALSRGFVDGAVVINYGPLLTDILTPVVNTSIVLDAEKGGVVITGPDLRGQYLSVSYTAGFEADPNDPEALTGLPRWLTEVATLSAMAALDSNQPSVRYGDSPQSATASAASLHRQVANRIRSKARFFPSATRPL